MPSDKYWNIYIEGSACFWTSSILHKIPILRSPTAARKLLSIWEKYRRLYGVKIVGYVVMPDHIHIIVWSEKTEQTELFIEQALRRSSTALLEMTGKAASHGDDLAQSWDDVFHMNVRPKVWKPHGHGFPITDHDTLLEKLEYIHANPVKAGLVTRAEDWQFSSASWYLHGTGPLEIDELGW